MAVGVTVIPQTSAQLPLVVCCLLVESVSTGHEPVFTSLLFHSCSAEEEG